MDELIVRRPIGPPPLALRLAAVLAVPLVLYALVATGQKAIDNYRMNQEVDGLRTEIGGLRAENISLHQEIELAASSPRAGGTRGPLVCQGSSYSRRTSTTACGLIRHRQRNGYWHSPSSLVCRSRRCTSMSPRIAKSDRCKMPHARRATRRWPAS